MTFADVTKHGKCKSTNLKSRIPKSTVLKVSHQVPSFEDFPLLGGVPTKKCVPTETVRKQDLPTKTGAVLVSGWAPVPIVPKVNDPPATRGHSKGVKGPSKPKKQNKKGGRFTLAWYKLYLDSCATYHASFVTSLL